MSELAAIAGSAFLGCTVLACGGIVSRASSDGGPAEQEASPPPVEAGGVAVDAGGPTTTPPCEGAQCGPVEELGPAGFGGGIASDGEYVYWLTETTSGALDQCAVSGCNQKPTELVSNISVGNDARGLSDCSLVAAGGGLVYWPESASVQDLSGASPPGTTFSMAAEPGQVVTDAANVYWTNIGGTTIQSCPLASSCKTPKTVVTTSAGESPLMLAVDGQYVYWSDTSWSIHSQPLAGGASVTLAKAGYVSALAAFGGRVYWTADDGCDDYPGLFTCPANAPCVPATYWNGEASSLAVDRATSLLYWTDAYDGTVLRCPLGSACPTPVTIAKGLAWPAMLTVDSTSVYLLAESQASGALSAYKTPK
jgi:hypothetical protein